MKIIVIGAGISGLTLAIACQRAGLNVSVYEKAQELTSIGGGILLWPHAIRCLKELQASDCLRDAWKSVNALDIVGYKGGTIFHEAFDDINVLLGGDILPIDRTALQLKLLNLLQPGTVVLNKSCKQVTRGERSATVYFADGSQDEADLIVGADGVGSVVRQHIFPEMQPRYSGFCWWGGIAEAEHVPNLNKDNVHFAMGINKVCSIWPTHGEKFMWYLPVKMPLEQFAEQGDGRAQAQGLVTGWNENAVRLVAAQQVAQRFHVPIYDLLPQPQQAANRVVVIGDAACTFGPLLGQGANKAIEDAYVLASLLTHQGSDLDACLRRYQALRFPRHMRLFELEQAASASLIMQDQQSLAFFEQEIGKINLVTMYQDLIPLVNEAATKQLMADAVTLADQDAA